MPRITSFVQKQLIEMHYDSILSSPRFFLITEANMDRSNSLFTESF